MPNDLRKKNMIWVIKENLNGSTPGMDAQLAVLMDIRDELQALNRIVGYCDFLQIPRTLKRISENTRKPKRRKKR